MAEDGKEKADLKLPKNEALCEELEKLFAEGKDLVVTVLNSMAEEMVCAVKEAKV
jgi:hypothetical protein